MSWTFPAVLALISAILSFPDPRFLALTILFCAGFYLLGRKPYWLVLLTFVAVGYLRLGCEPKAPELEPLLSRQVEIPVTVLEATRRRGRGVAFRARVESLPQLPDQEPFPVWVELDQELELLPGESWLLFGNFAKPDTAAYPGGFDPSLWLRRQGVAWTFRVSHFSGRALFVRPVEAKSPRRFVFWCRARMMDNLARHLKGRPLALLSGIVFGETQSLDRELSGWFRVTGTTHLLAASGLNVAIVVGLCLALGGALGWGPWRCAPAAIVPAWFYAFLAGGAPSVVRAAMMATLGLLVWHLGRETEVWHQLGLTTLLSLLVSPHWLMDIGFQLSLGAVVGILVFYPPVNERLSRLPGFIAGGMAMTLAASLGTLPIMLWYFQQLAPWSLAANLLMGPMAEFLLVAGLVVAWAPLRPLVKLLEFLLHLMIELAHGFASLTPDYWVARPSTLQTLGLTGLLVALALAFHFGRSVWGPCLVVSAALAAFGGPARQEPFIRVVDLGCRVVWIHDQSGDHLLLEEDWAEPRARAMLRQHGAAAPTLPPGVVSGARLHGWYLETKRGWIDLKAVPPRRELTHDGGDWLVTDW